VGVPGDGDALLHLSCHQRALPGWSRRPPLLPIRPEEEEDFAQQFEEREGLIYEVMTHLNSAYKGLFAGIYFVKSSGSPLQSHFSFMLLFWLKL
jgi:hypothetical protein